MKRKILDQAIERVIARSHIESQAIPDLDLYIDQIMTLFDSKLEDNKRYPEDKLLTKTMINNYSKAKLLTPVKGKKYTKEQIVQMLIIFQLKNSITMPEIKQLMNPIYETDITKTYDRFIEMQRILENNLQDFIYKQVQSQNLNIEDEEDAFLIMASMLSLSESLNTTVKYMLDGMRDEK